MWKINVIWPWDLSLVRIIMLKKSCHVIEHSCEFGIFFVATRKATLKAKDNLYVLALTHYFLLGISFYCSKKLYWVSAGFDECAQCIFS